MSFDPKEKLIVLQGKKYLEVRWRVVWFREEHPTGGIITELVSVDERAVIAKATIINGEGHVLACDYASAAAGGIGAWTGRAVEKATTAAVGRALALCGYGTQFDARDDEEHLSDSPVESRALPQKNPTPKPATPKPTPPKQTTTKQTTTKQTTPSPDAWTEADYLHFAGMPAVEMRKDIRAQKYLTDALTNHGVTGNMVLNSLGISTFGDYPGTIGQLLDVVAETGRLNKEATS